MDAVRTQLLRAPRRAQQSPREPQEASKTAPRRPQTNMASRRPTMPPRRPNRAPRGPPSGQSHRFPRRFLKVFGALALSPIAQDGPKSPQYRFKTAQEAPKMAPRRPERSPRRPKRPPRLPKRPPREPQRPPRRPKSVSPTSAQARGSLRDRSGISILPPRASPAEDKRRYNYLLGVVKSRKEVKHRSNTPMGRRPGEF